jgi:alkylated DNA repair protein alkB family protein 6
MSTAIDYASLLRRAKAAKKPTQNEPIPASTTVQSKSVVEKSFLRRPDNHNYLVSSHLVPPEGLERAFYVADFLSEEEESLMLSKIYSGDEMPPEAASKWVQLSHRRLKVFGGTPDAQGTYQRPLPTWVDDFVSECLVPYLASTPPLNEEEKSAVPDHVLLNEYSGGMGIGAHYDGPLYHERVVVLNLQSPATIYFYKEEQNGLVEALSLVLEPRSLLIFEGKLYSELKHGIPNATQDDLSGKPKPQNYAMLSAQNRALLDANQPIPRGELPRLSLTLRKIKYQAKWSESEVVTSEEKAELRRAQVNFYRNVSEHN